MGGASLKVGCCVLGKADLPKLVTESVTLSLSIYVLFIYLFMKNILK